MFLFKTFFYSFSEPIFVNPFKTLPQTALVRVYTGTAKFCAGPLVPPPAVASLVGAERLRLRSLHIPTAAGEGSPWRWAPGPECLAGGKLLVSYPQG